MDAAKHPAKDLTEAVRQVLARDTTCVDVKRQVIARMLTERGLPATPSVILAVTLGRPIPAQLNEDQQRALKAAEERADADAERIYGRTAA